MAHFKDHFSQNASAYARHRPTYPAELFEFLASRCSAHQLAVECGAGNGQASQELKHHFAQVLATEPSAAQLTHARGEANLHFLQAQGERIPARDATTDLVAVAQAIHWFDHSNFFTEVERVLKPSGLLAVWGYALAMISPEIDAVVDIFYREVLGSDWPPERHHIEEKYQGIPFPWPKMEHPEFKMTANWNLEAWIGYLHSWSASKRYLNRTGSNPLEAVSKELNDAWGDPELSRPVEWPLLFYLGRKP